MKQLKVLYYESVKKRHFNLFLQRDEQSTYFEGMMDAYYNVINDAELCDDIREKAIEDAKRDYKFYSNIG